MKKLLILKEGQHTDAEMYIKAIKKEAEKRNVLVDVIDIKGIKFIRKDLNIINGLVESDGVIIANPVRTSMELINEIFIWKEKDLDDFTLASPYINCTLEAIIDVLEQQKINISSKDIVVLGRHLGKEIGDYMEKQDATVTVCHSKTRHLKLKTVMADIVICCADANKKILTPDMIAPDTLVIDVGGNTEGAFKNIVAFREIGRRNINNIFKHMEG